MLSRVLAPLLALVVVSTGLLVVPVLDAMARERTAEVALQRREVLDRIASLARAAIQEGDDLALRRYLQRHHAVFGESALVIDTTEQVLQSSGDLSPADARVARRTRDSGYNVPSREIPRVLPWGPATTVLSTPVEVDQDVASGAVLLEVDLRAARDDVRQGWSSVLVPAVAGLALLALAALRAARWVLRPVHALEAATRTLAAGESAPAVAVGGPPELRRLAQAFSTMSGTLSATLTQQRDLVSNASHQLRNPLAALRLNVDLLSVATDADRGRIAAVQADLDRLDHTIDRLLGLAEAEHRVLTARAARLAEASPDPSTADGTTGEELRAHVCRRWTAVGARSVAVEPGLVVAVPTAELLEMVDTLVENALKYAGPHAVVQVGLRAGAGEDAVVLSVEDDGEGLSDAELTRAQERFWRSSRHAEHPGSGLGLAIVDALARAAGGAMTVGRSGLGGFAVRLDLPRTR